MHQPVHHDMRFEELAGRRAEAALELLSEGECITFRGLVLRLANSTVECRVFVEYHLDILDAAGAEHCFSVGRALLTELLTDPRFASVLAGRTQRWELVGEYGGDAFRLCRLDDAGTLVWQPGWPKAAR